MDKIKFLGKGSFPASANTLDNLQNQIQLVSTLAMLGGTDYVLSGCDPDGDNKVKAGILIIAGEILPFTGGIMKEYVSIRETKQSLMAFGNEYPEAYTFRVAEFSDNGVLKWENLKQVLSNTELQERIESIKGDAPGIVKMWSGRIEKIPADYKPCDGLILSIRDYPELYENIGVSFGGDGVNNFALPDLRGRFIVGHNSSNPDYSTINKDSKGGVESVTLTTEQIPEHDHVKNPTFNKFSARANVIDEQSSPGSIDRDNAVREYNVGSMSEDRWQDATIQKVGGGKSHENRPPYFVLAYIIKVK